MTMKGKARKKGDWVAVAKGRSGRAREVASRASMTGMNYPKQGDVGSAAYRRQLASRGSRRSGR